MAIDDFGRQGARALHVAPPNRPTIISREMEPIRIEATVAKDGMLLIPQLKAGDEVEVIVHRKPKKKKIRRGGWAKGKIKILPGFDDPIPGMEEYM